MTLAAVALGCASRAAREAAPPAQVVVVEEGTAAPEPVEAHAPPRASAPEPAEEGELPEIWSSPAPPAVHFAEQLALARELRVRLAALPARGGGDGAEARSSFAQRQTLFERASTAYALAAGATDAGDEGRVTAMSEAAETMLEWSRSLDALGLSPLPASWRADTSLRLSFEDVSAGPAKHWRTEGAALARHCVRVAEAAHVSSAPAGRCRALEERVAKVTRAPRDRADAGVGSACACDPLDPLCASSLGPWCERRR